MTITTTTKKQSGRLDFWYYELVRPASGCIFYRLRADTPWTGTHTAYSKTVNSVNSPEYATKKKVYVQFVPKRPLKKPIEPRLRLAKLPTKPTRRPSQSKRSFDRVLSNYSVLHASIVQKRKKQLEGYDVAMQRYKVALTSWAKYTALASAGRPVLKRVINRLARIHNPYTKTQIIYHPLTGESKTGIRNSNITGCQTFVQGLKPPNGVETYTLGSGNHELWLGAPGYPGPGNDYNACVVASDGAARSKLRSNMNEQYAHVGNIIAQRHETIKMLGDIAKAILRMTPKQFVKRLTTRKGIADNVLAYNFGVVPLISDAYGIAQSLAKLSFLPDKIVVYGKSSKTCSVLTYSDTLFSSGIPYLKREFFEETKVTTNYVCEYSIDNGSLSYLNGIGLVNPAEIAWEVMPWSFVVDWFLPIGNFISALSSEAGLKFLTGSKTVKITRRQTARYTYTNIPRSSEGWQREKGTLVGSKTTISQTREVLTSTPNVQLPSFRNPFSFLHLAEALSLISQRFK